MKPAGGNVERPGRVHRAVDEGSVAQWLLELDGEWRGRVARTIDVASQRADLDDLDGVLPLFDLDQIDATLGGLAAGTGHLDDEQVQQRRAPPAPEREAVRSRVCDSGAVEAVRLLVAASFALVAFTAVRVRLRNPAPSTTWLAGMFCTLAFALLVSRLLGDEREGWKIVVGIGSSALIVAFPYLLFRFAESFRSVAPARRRAVTALIAVTIGGVAVNQTLNATLGEDPARDLLVLVVVIGAWTGLTGWVVWRLWSAGRDQPALTRRRMHTMAAAAALLNVALVLAGVGTGGLVPLLAQIIALGSAYTFVLAFAPPRFIRAVWRQADERELWQRHSRCRTRRCP